VSATDDAGRLDAALDELYGVDPDEFVATRKRLAAELKAEGATSVAKEVQGARRPTVAAWALNQLRRRETDRLAEFLARSRDLRNASRDELRDAMAAQRTAFNALADAALGVLGARANDGYRTQITATLHAATADEAVAAQLAQGRLTREIAEVGFPASGPVLSSVPSPPAPSRRARKEGAAPPVEPEPSPGPSAEQRRVEEEGRLLDEALRTAEQEAAAAAERHDEAKREVEQRTAELDRARFAARAAAEHARQAKREVDRLTKARARRG
jgi:hypothetical protein